MTVMHSVFAAAVLVSQQHASGEAPSADAGNCVSAGAVEVQTMRVVRCSILIKIARCSKIHDS